MEKEELKDILQELSDAPNVFRNAIKVYNNLSNSNPNKKILGEAIKSAKQAAIELDVHLEDIIWNWEREEIIALSNLKMDT